MAAQQVVDYDALAAQHGGAPVTPSAPTSTPPPAVDYDALAAQHGGAPAAAAPAMNFAIVNGQRVPVDEPNSIGTFARHLWTQLNPITAIQTVGNALIPEAAARAMGATDANADQYGPINLVQRIGAAQEELYHKAEASYRRGDYGTAARHFVDYLIPIFGPVIDRSSDLFQAGHWAAGSGDAMGLGLAVLGPRAINEMRSAAAVPRAAGDGPVSTAAPRRLTPAEAASNAFAREQGVPLDAATATGSRNLRAAQKRVANSMGGEGTAERTIRAQHEALTQVGDELARATHPESVTPLQAGEAVSDAITGQMRRFNAEASDAYEKLRAYESDPDLSLTVHTAPIGSRNYQKLIGKLAAGLEDGQPPTVPELKAMRQIEIELDSQPYTPRLLQPAQYGGGLEHVPGTGGAGAPVYHEILQAAPGTADMTRGEVLAGVRKALEDGEWTNAGRGALEVARQRLRTGRALAGPTLDPNGPILGRVERVGLPVDLRQAKAILMPLYERLRREGELVPLQGDKARALLALDRLIGGPDLASASVVDAALGDLKAMARTDIPELRTTGQGLAAMAVKTLEPKLQEAVRKAGPEAINALEEGRGLTTAKYYAGDALRQLVGNDAARMEPVKVFAKLTAPHDSAIALLRKARELAPEEMEQIGRAWLDERLALAGERGAFDHAARLYADWQRLGPETKSIVFGRAQVPALDRFFLLAKRIAENPNPSGTAHTLTALNFGSIPVTWGLAKLLYTPRGVATLTRLLDVDLRSRGGGVGAAARRAAWIDVANAARVAGVPVTAAKEEQSK